MTLIDAVILGIVQGLTEFIPVSSSGHLIVVREAFGLLSFHDLAVDAVLQLATIFAVFAYFFNDIVHLIRSFFRLIFGKIVADEDKRMMTAILLGTIPAVFFGLILEDSMETIFRSADLVAWTLLFGAALMYTAERLGKEDKVISPSRGIIVGLFQSLALVPGVSRSGATISGGLIAGLTRQEATRFSFLLAFPIILGSGLKKALDLFDAGGIGAVGPSLAVGFLVSFVVGLCAIHFLIRYLKNHKLTIFIWYRIILASLIFLFL